MTFKTPQSGLTETHRRMTADSLASRPRSNARFRELEELLRIIENRSVQPVFQPILAFGTGEILAYEGLIRGPDDSPLHTPTKLFDAATRAGQLIELNMLCARKVVRQYARLGLQQQLFLNVTPQTVLDVRDDVQRISRFIKDCGMDIAQVTIELTESQYISNRSIFRDALMLFRKAGFRVALDDLGEGFSSLRLWLVVRTAAGFCQDRHALRAGRQCGRGQIPFPRITAAHRGRMRLIAGRRRRGDHG